MTALQFLSVINLCKKNQFNIDNELYKSEEWAVNADIRYKGCLKLTEDNILLMFQLPEDQEEDVLNHLHKAHEIAKAG